MFFLKVCSVSNRMTAFILYKHLNNAVQFLSLNTDCVPVSTLSLKWESSKWPRQFGQRHRDRLHGVAEERAREAATETY